MSSTTRHFGVIRYSDDGANNNHNNILVSCDPDKVHFLLFQLQRHRKQRHNEIAWGSGSALVASIRVDDPATGGVVANFVVQIPTATTTATSNH
jgi:hypothetical protein